MPEIRVLLYTDWVTVTVNKAQEFGLYYLMTAVRAKQPPYAQIKFELINRHAGDHALNKLTSDLLNQFHELWVFGLRQINRSGQAENELTVPELQALSIWMSTGGVLITGDHASQNPVTKDPNPATYLNLGRALGYQIPRARELRAWQGPPTANTNDNFNTQVPSDLHDINSPKLQEDGRAQRLILDTINGNVHRLFWKNIQQSGGGISFEPIYDFPDHMHEGAALIPTSFGGDWPGSARPRRVASGIDRRTGSALPVVITYDGGTAAGRIVADSSWHHYFNINLRGFPKKANDEPLPNTEFDDIAQYYVNLALWLAPKSLRDQMPVAILSFLARHPQVFEVARSSTYIVGRTARVILERDGGISDFLRFILPSDFDEDSPDFHHLLLSVLFTTTDDKSQIEEHALGAIIEQFHETWLDEGIDDPSDAEGAFDESAILKAGLLRAINLKSEQAQSLSERLREEARMYRDKAEEIRASFLEGSSEDESPEA